MATETACSELKEQEYILVWDASSPVEYEKTIHYRSPNFISLLNVNKEGDYYIHLKLRRENGSDFDICNVEVICGAAVIKSILFVIIENEIVKNIDLKENNKITSDMLAKGKFVVKLHMKCTYTPVIPPIWLEGKTVVSQTSFKSAKVEQGTKKFSVMMNKIECTVTYYYNSGNYGIFVAPIPRLWGIIVETSQYEFIQIDKASRSIPGIRDIYTYNYIPFHKMDNASISMISTIMNNDLKEEHNRVSHTELTKVQPLITEHLSPNYAVLYNLYTEKKLCDITIQSHDSKIRAHKVVLASCSSIWRELLIADESLDIIHIIDFDIKTIKDLIEFIYNGTELQSSNANYEHLLMAADKYEITGLKERCAALLMEAISMKSVVHLAILAHQYKAPTLLDKVFSFIRENYAEFKKLKEFESLFFAYPELAFKIVKLE